MRLLSALLVLAASLSGLAQSDHYARPGQVEDFTVLWKRSPSSPQAPAQGGGAEGGKVQAPAAPESAFPLPLFAPSGPAGKQGLKAAGDGPIPPGLFFKGKLVTGVLASPGLASPVLLEAAEDWCGKSSCGRLLLLGLATLSANGRATVVFTQGVLDGAPVAADAVAFDAKDRQFGVRGEVVDIAPALAADLVRAAVGGLADWVRALNNQTTVSLIPGGGVATQFQAAPFWAYALGRIGQTVAPPQDTTTLVRAVVTNAGSEVWVLTGAASLIQGQTGGTP